jgi:exonuclease III
MIKIATLNVKGLNNKPKAQKTFTLLKLYNLDIILLQETNLKDISLRNFLAKQWGFDSIWSSKTAILAGKRNIKLTNMKESLDG